MPQLESCGFFHAGVIAMLPLPCGACRAAVFGMRITSLALSATRFLRIYSNFSLWLAHAIEFLHNGSFHPSILQFEQKWPKIDVDLQASLLR
ncbi:hypothetical protein [Paenibacillus dendritiformis]|uniref:hypothetical protein n=1 Tax=Paenibacillus dendritiformis TaxID=130049 RepID=UPI0011B665F0|nr:hypothetical protein [Paenibacillus dendritiformis]